MRKTVLKLGVALGFAAAGFGSMGLAEDARAETTAIVGATIFDAAGTPPYVGAVVIRNGRIAEVGPNVRPPRGARIIRAEGQALLPGFYDVHTHWTPDGSPTYAPAVANAYIAAGVTTVNDFSQPPEAFEPLRAWTGRLYSPHVNYTARLSTPGGHGADWVDQATTRWVWTPDAARRALAELVSYRPDNIKAFADGWRYGRGPDNTSMGVNTLTAIAEESHRLNLSVLTHTVTAGRGAEAGRAGVDVIAHSLQDRLLAAEEIAQIRAGGAAYTGTLALSDPQKRGGAPLDMSDPNVQQRERNRSHAMRNLKALFDAGVPIVLGTDAGMPGTPHGYSTLREMELMVDAGLTPTDALLAGTINSARAMRQDDDRGSIQVGKRADVILIAGRPWETIADIHNIGRVFVDGRQVFGPGTTPNPLNAETYMASVRLTTPLVDDFEREDGRTALDTLRTDDPDWGIDRSVQVTQVIARDTGHALHVSASLAVKDDNRAAVVLPLGRGAIIPMDVRNFQGVRLEIRGGGGDYRLGVRTLEGRWSAPAPADGEWRTVTVPFSDLRRDPGDNEGRTPSSSRPAWTGSDVLSLDVAAQGASGGRLWYQIDNVTFY